MTATADGTSGYAGALPFRVEAWLNAVLDGAPADLQRAAARREAWLVQGGDRPLWLRLCHEGDPANSKVALTKETMVVRGLGRTDVPVPEVVAVAPDHEAVLFEKVDGRSDLHNSPPEQQHAVYLELLAVLDSLHDLRDLPSLGIDLGPPPATAQECALNEVDNILAAVGGTGGEPLAAFGLNWLRRRAPREVDHVALVHGDAGISNFLFVDDRITALVDWEWAHLGDPMEDMGNVLIHASFFPSGEWPVLLDDLQRRRAAALDLDRLRYYIVHNLVRSVLALAPITRRINARDPLDLNLCYEVLCHRMLCEATAAAEGLQLDRPAPPEGPDQASVLTAVAERLEEQMVSLPRPSAHHEELAALHRLVEYADRRERFGPWLDDAERTELAVLLGRRPATVRQGLEELADLVAGQDRTDEEVLRYLANRSYRAESVAAPLLHLVPDVALRPLQRSGEVPGAVPSR